MFNWLKRKSTTTLTVQQLAQFLGLANATWNTKDYRSYAREGYIKNIVVYHCISSIAKGLSNIPYVVQINGKQVEKHPIVSLLKRPNSKQSYNSFMRWIVMYRLISGNNYILGNIVSTGRVMELTNLRPDRVTIKTNGYEEPVAFEYLINGNIYTYLIDSMTDDSEILHLKEPNPLCDLYGLSPIQAAAMGIDQHNESGEWNKKLLENSARPPGILAMKDKGDTAPNLKPEQLKQISEDLHDKFSGYKNAGKIPVINFDMEWRAMGMSPADMEWINAKNTTSRDICLAFGYPALLLGMPEGATFSNVSEAKLSLYEDTIVPLMQDILSELSHYLSIKTKTEINIVPDLDQVSALSPRRETIRKNARDDMTAGVITPNEAREEIGYDAVPGGDDLLVPAGKLPINFDVGVGSLNKSDYQLWLKSLGFSDNTAKEMALIAYKE